MWNNSNKKKLAVWVMHKTINGKQIWYAATNNYHRITCHWLGTCINRIWRGFYRPNFFKKCLYQASNITTFRYSFMWKITYDFDSFLDFQLFEFTLIFGILQNLPWYSVFFIYFLYFTATYFTLINYHWVHTTAKYFILIIDYKWGHTNVLFKLI